MITWSLCAIFDFGEGHHAQFDSFLYLIELLYITLAGFELIAPSIRFLSDQLELVRVFWEEDGEQVDGEDCQNEMSQISRWLQMDGAGGVALLY